ncbi:cytochrome o ubiquinol oxidase subunit IV [Novosphingobium sp. FGD1]|jgi:cytochrome o ubiquinol oxidase operon protein cyoD|uniref:Cytochrome bo(3) ubiquinol oxidase subunit 4 n=1 Tax=Novosphingobium silvae TaxID=2692619 RepID=A0A7X4GJ93_9SPHN|nr:cytochrome o ubiquinol oxidase subunit IV [Novosphingobium silvae]MYL99660.1 cytochrome o ubiquinol oxidase subunit IV [Novosphingobium silvae]
MAHADTHTEEHAHPHPGADKHDAMEHGGHGSMREYVVGFILSVVLTAIPFWLVMSGAIPDGRTTALVIMAFAIVQIVVHMIYFLHMNTKSENGWTVMALIFTIVIVVIALSGSLWVMYHLNTNMMPMSHDMSQMP